MRVISASRRTDIPAFYSEWLLRRVRAGYCHWINPFGGQVYRVSLKPDDCLAIVFWTRNPRPLLAHLPFLRDSGYRFYLNFTINGYPRPIEAHNPPVRAAVEAFHRVADFVGPALVQWRYDPILITDRTPTAYHVDRFTQLSGLLEGATERCILSFADFYGKTTRNLRALEQEHGIRVDPDPPIEDRRALAAELGQIAQAHGMHVFACCSEDLVGDRVRPAHCIDAELLARLVPGPLPRLKSCPTRKECGCVEAVDIGAYDSCVFGCAYCYATNSRATASARLREHDPDDSLLWRPPSLRGKDLALLDMARQRAAPGAPATRSDGL
jgi:hypothetical protein